MRLAAIVVSGAWCGFSALCMWIATRHAGDES